MAVPERYVACDEGLPDANTHDAPVDEARVNTREAMVLVLDANRARAEEDLVGATMIPEPLPEP